MRSYFLIALTLVGFTMRLNSAQIIATNDVWKYFKGTSEASTPVVSYWRSIGFDDSQWLSGSGPFYYEDQPDSANAYTGNTDLTDMKGSYSSLFLRHSFTISKASDISTLTLEAFSDDGFIAWINGVEVARFNMPEGDVVYNASSLSALSEPVAVQKYVLQTANLPLTNGVNVLAIQAFNSSIGNSSDFVISTSLSCEQDVFPPLVEKCIPEANALIAALKQIEIIFNEPVMGVDASDLLINGSPAAKVTGISDQDYIFEFSQPSTGTVQVAWSTKHNITDLAGTPNPFAGGSWTYYLDPKMASSGVMISEFMANDDKTLHDENGDSSDWIEIYNSGTNTTRLGGWFLTDQTNILNQWQFPNVTLLAKSYLVVFASGKDRTNVTSQLHTKFRLNKSGGYLALIDPQTNIVSEFVSYPAQKKDVSYGRDRSNPSLLSYFPKPTPGAANTVGGPGFSSKVHFSVQGCTFSSTLAVELTTDDTNGVIRYTTNGTMPDVRSSVYANAFSIANTLQIQAVTFTPGLLSGPPHTETYLKLDSNVINFTSDLPLVVIHNFAAGSVPSGVRQYANISVFSPGTTRSSLTNQPDLSTRAGINIRGSSTMGQAKKNFRIEFWDEFGSDQSHPLLGMPEDSDWVLYACNNYEPVLIHNPFMHELSRQIGRYSPRCRLVEVYINTAGGAIAQANYNGVYVLLEKPKIASHRVDIDKLQPEHNKNPEITGGYFMSIDRSASGEGQLYTDGIGINCLDPKWEEITQSQRSPQYEYINDFFSSLSGALSSSSFTNPATGYAQYIDVDSAIDHHILNVLAFNVDALRLSSFIYKPRGGKLNFGPLWDFDRALNSTDGRDSNPRIWRSASGDNGTDMFNYDWIFANPWYSKMFTDPDFWQHWIDRWQLLRKSQFAITNLYSLADSLADQVREAERREIVRWSSFTSPRYGSYQGEVNAMKTWLSNRVDFIDTNFVSAPVIASASGVFTNGFAPVISAKSGSAIYYTLDGTDPRLPGGAIAPNAQIYSSQTRITNNVRFIARARNVNHKNLTGASKPPISSPWSGPVNATYLVNNPDVAITEIMYHPIAFTDGDTKSGEYIELLNCTDQPIALGDSTGTNGWHLEGGIAYTFEAGTILKPGQYLILTGFNPTNTVLLSAFKDKYLPSSNPIFAGPFAGDLSNEGETIRLVKPATQNSAYAVVDEVKYSSQAPWPVLQTGFEMSLQRLDNSQYGGSPANWVAAVPTVGGPAVDNRDTDGDGLPDWWETAHGLDPNDAAGINGTDGDPDQDGFSNRDEFLAGTDPQDASSYLKVNVFEINNGIVTLHFNGQKDKSYTLLYRDNLNAGSWQVLTNMPSLSASGDIQITDPARVTTNRFYRIATP